MYDWHEQKGRDDGRRVRKIYQQQHRLAQHRPQGHAGQTCPIKGGQRPWTQREGFVVEVPFSRALYLPRSAKCNLRPDGTDEQDPNFDAYQDIQSQNNYSTAQLNLMGYRGDVPRAVFRPDKISERKASVAVTVANTRKRQEAIATAHMHGSKFYVTGGKHVTSNDMLKATEVNRRKAEAAEREKDKKRRVEFHARREAALPILNRLEHELENDVAQLTSKELEVLLW